MTYPYNPAYEPPFPMMTVSLHNATDQRRTEILPALVDTGSDGTIVPIGHLEQILAQPLHDTYIRSHWGERRLIQIFVVDVELNGLTLSGVFVVGDEQGDEVILDRDVLNKLRLTLDGPDEILKILA